MAIDEIMDKLGFTASLSGGGCEWYTKKIQFKDKDAFVTITDDGGLGLPDSLEEPVYVCIYDINNDDIIEDVKLVGSLREYLDQMQV